ncbi:Signal transduction histidine kinase [Roseateles sp. YR242]|uniref:sensor histidine kinase n=1 Tax=Roseateles sp. YR242 TaxID=1855305 RepID=UPI0008C6E8CD|nr:sensor histidine kinase [Roseateles sp. YR242]SEK40620.1 Signal transduction histidine kinase [Roseateles sp. YR242]
MSAFFHRPAWVWLAAWLWISLGNAHALDRSRTLAQLNHTRWTANDGAPVGIRKISQTTDGWLWLGSTSGLYRFDGVRFERFAPPQDPDFGTRPVSTLAAGRAGELWVGLLDGGIAHVDGHGTLTVHELPAGLTSLQTRGLAALPSGEAWADMDGVLLHYDGKAWRRPDASFGAPQTPVVGVHADANGDLWITSAQRWLRLDPASHRFVEMARDMPDARGTRIIDGMSWLVSAQGLHPLPASQSRDGQFRPQRDSSAIWVDRQHNLWNVYCPAGLCRSRLPVNGPATNRDLPLPAVEETFTRRDGLTSDIGMTVLEDRDGNLWVATQTGLDRFRNTLLARLSPSSAATNFLLQPYRAVSPNGQVDQQLLLSAVDATHGSTLWRWNEAAGFSPLPWPREGGRIRALHRDTEGREWIGGSTGVWQLHGSTAQHLPSPGAPDAATNCRQLRSNRLGLWALFALQGLQLWREGGWRALPFPGLENERPTAFALEGEATLWTGYAVNRVLRTDVQGSQVFDARQGLAVGAVNYVASGRHLLVAGDRGVQMLLQGRFHQLKATDADALRGITGAVDTPAGDLWLNGLRGAVLIRAEALARLEADPATVLPVRVFDAGDGYPAGATPFGPQPSVAHGGAGQLWFAGLDGLASLDTERLPAPRAGPPVQWLAVAADQQWSPWRKDLTLPAGTQTVSVRYTSLELGMPERVRFEARLEGVDPAWRPLGAQRELSYSHLPPGRHQLQVRAAMGDGPMGDPPAVLSVVLRPTLTQTLWFKALAVLGSVALLALAIRWRTRLVGRREQELLRTRMDEREQIAQEMNDILLQGLHGLTLHFQKVANRMGGTDPNRALMNTALDRADQLILRGREQVSQLRETLEERHQELPVALSDFGERLAATHARDFVMDVDGHPRRLRLSASEHLRLLGQELMTNAFTHAQATDIRARVVYRWWSLRLIISDNGIGMRAQGLAQDRLGGGGIAGLARVRDRVQQLGGRVHIRTAPASGTEVTVRVGARQVYEHPWWPFSRETDGSEDLGV